MFLGEDMNNPQHLLLCAVLKQKFQKIVAMGIFIVYNNLIHACVHIIHNCHYCIFPYNLLIYHMYHECELQDFSNASFQTTHNALFNIST